ncbi:ATP-binding cassette domain-containing protein [Emcibacter sp. SYSU 3D8]|uniref:ABC transporter ATP-binding protein n=1 Tax=Emcibacter sp. SYSU 3D8 TaxID=3133969 RepID=UPI0031FEBA72
MDSPKLSLQDVRKRFGSKVVLDGIDLDVYAGESVVIMGGSGTGKSVMLKCILGLIQPDSGRILLDGQDITHIHGREREQLLRRFGMLFQGGALFDSLRVWRNVSFGLIAAHRMRKQEARAQAVEILAKVGLAPEVGDLRPAELSGGMQKRVALARAIATNPEIIFFDEPTAGLDPIMADVINNLIIERVRDLGATALTITHDMASARKIADRIGMLHGGRIIWIGPAADVDNSGNPYVEQFIHGRAEGPITMTVRRT